MHALMHTDAYQHLKDTTCQVDVTYTCVAVACCMLHCNVHDAIFLWLLQNKLCLASNQ